MTIDSELQHWRQDWRERTEPLPEWKSRIRRQNLWMAGAVIALAVCLTLSTWWALQARSAFAAGLAVGMWLATVISGGYAWRVRRGAWKPDGQTTLAYMELAHRRAVAKARQLRFSFYFLLCAMLLFAAFSVWNERGLSLRDLALLAAFVIELIYFRRSRYRKQREAESTRKLIDEMKTP